MNRWKERRVVHAYILWLKRLQGEAISGKVTQANASLCGVAGLILESIMIGAKNFACDITDGQR